MSICSVKSFQWASISVISSLFSSAIGRNFITWSYSKPYNFKFYLLVCLFVWFFSHSRIFHSYGDVTIAGEGLQILNYARHLWLLSSEGYVACHTYCDTEHPFIMLISEDPWHSHLMPSVCQWNYHYLFLRFMSVAVRIRTPNLLLARRTL